MDPCYYTPDIMADRNYNWLYYGRFHSHFADYRIGYPHYKIFSGAEFVINDQRFE